MDYVRWVFEMVCDQINPPPRIGTSIRAGFIKGMGKQNGEFIMILEIGKLFSAEELQMLESQEEPDSALA